VNATIYYTPQILKDAGVTDLFAGLGLSDESAAIMAATVTYFLKIPAILITMQLMDRTGRRRLLLYTVPVLAGALAVLAVAFSLEPGTTAQPVLSMCAIAVYGCFFSAALGPIPNILCSEIFPLPARALGVAACIAVQWAFNILVSQTFPILLDAAGAIVTFSIFAGLCAAAFVFIWIAVPETKGHALDAVADEVLAVDPRTATVGAR
jgi:MFS family permease